MRALLMTAVVGLGCASSVSAAIEVVADSACPYYAMDIAAFATCEGDRVARAAPLVAAGAPAVQAEVQSEAATATVVVKEPRVDRIAVRKARVGGSTRAASRAKSS